MWCCRIVFTLAPLRKMMAEAMVAQTVQPETETRGRRGASEDS